MSTFKVPLLQITEIHNHPNADRLELAIVAESPVVVGKGQYRVGDTVVYVPIGSVLPPAIKDRLLQNSKISLGNKIKAVRIRGIVSQGLILDPKEHNIASAIGALTVGEAVDVSKELDIKKYEEAERPISTGSGKTARKRPGNPLFRYYTDIENVKHYPNVIPDGELVWITEKLHGTSFRCGWFPKTTLTFWERVKKFFHRPIERYEFLYGSRKIDITASRGYIGWYGEDIYGSVAKKLDLANRIPKGYAIYGEIVGPGIQKNYSYGYKEPTLFVYDILDTENNIWLDAEEGSTMARMLGLATVPLLADAQPYNRQAIEETYVNGQLSVLDEIAREGVVVKPLRDRIDNRVGRVIFKFINPEYLMKDTTEFQ